MRCRFVVLVTGALVLTARSTADSGANDALRPGARLPSATATALNPPPSAAAPSEAELAATLNAADQSYQAGYYDGYYEGHPQLEPEDRPVAWDTKNAAAYDEGKRDGLADGTAERFYGETASTVYSEAWYDYQLGDEVWREVGCAIVGLPADC